MQTIFKKGMLLLSFAFLVMGLSGCIEAPELKDRTIIKMVGVDREGEEYLLTLLRFSPSGSLEESGGEKVTYIETKGKSISEAIDRVSHYTGNEIFLGNTSLLVLGKQAAENDLENCLSFFNENYEVNPELFLTLASDTAQEVIAVQAKQDDVPTQLKNLIRQGEKNGLLGQPTLRDVMNRLQSNCSDPYLPMIEAVEVEEDKKILKIAGMGICKDGKLKMTIPVEEIRGVLWATDELNRALVTVDFGEEDKSTASVILNGSKSRVKVRIENDAPVITLSIHTKGSLNEVTSSQGAGAKLEEIKEIEDKTARKIEKAVEKTLEKIFFSEKCDVFRYSEFIKKQQPHYWKAHREEQEKVIEQTKVIVKAECRIEHLGLETKHSQETGRRSGKNPHGVIK